MSIAFSAFFGILLISAVSTLDESCSGDAEFDNGSRFSSTKTDGRMYRCTCYGTGCIRITCTRSRAPTPPPPSTAAPSGGDPNDITGEVPDGPIIIQPSVLLPVVIQPSVSLPSSSGCYDRLNNQNYNRGDFFVRNLNRGRRQYCVCPSTGRADISCQAAPRTCTLPKAPRLVMSMRYIHGCFDSWNKQEYASGTTYTRVRNMSSDGRMRGEYQCICNSGMMRCSAVDIPCCNIATGEYVGMDERFIVSHRGIPMNCMCKRQRGRYAECYPADGSSNTVTPTYHPIGRDSQCLDQYSLRRWPVGSQWYQNRGYATFKCSCSRRANKVVSTCNYYSPNRRG